MAVKAAREELSAKLVDEFRFRDVTVLPPTLNVMSLEELMAALAIEVRCSKFLRSRACRTITKRCLKFCWPSQSSLAMMQLRPNSKQSARINAH